MEINILVYDGICTTDVHELTYSLLWIQGNCINRKYSVENRVSRGYQLFHIEKYGYFVYGKDPCR